MIFQLEAGGHTKVFFYKDEEGVIQPFPSDNADIVRVQGNKESKERLNKILNGGEG